MDFFKGFIYFFFNDLWHSIKAALRSFSCASVMLQHSGPAVVGFLGFSGDIVLVAIDCILGLVSRHPGLGRL